MKILGLDRFAKVGKIGKAHALSGTLKLFFHYPLKENGLSNLSHLFVDVVSPPIPFFIEWVKSAPQEGIYHVKFESTTDKEEATILANKEVYLTKEEISQYFAIPEKDVFSLEDETDVTGFTIFDSNHGTIGTIEGVYEVAEQLLVQVTYQGHEVMIPLNNETLKQVDDNEKVIYVNLPEGLLAIYLE